MNTTKPLARVLALLAFGAFFASPLLAEGENLLVAKIKIDIDSYFYSWDSVDSQPRQLDGPESGQPGTNPLAIAELVGISPGQRIARAELETKLSAAESRMRASGLFYNLGISIIELKEPENSVAIFIQATTGFTWRFSGGPIYAYLSNINADRSFLEYAFALGYNYDYAEIGRGSQAASPLWWRLGFGYSNNLLGTPPFDERHDLQLDYTMGSATVPFGLRLSSSFFYSFGPSIPNEASYGISLKLHGTEGMSSGTFMDSSPGESGGPKFAAFAKITPIARLLYYAPFDRAILTGEAILSSGLSYGGLYFKAMAAAGASSEALPSRFRFDLYGDEAINVRGGYDAPSLSLDRFASLKLELGFEFLRIPLGFVSDFSVLPYAYTDFASGSLLSEASAFGRFFIAYGFGVKLVFGSPVFVTANLSYGFSANGLPRFCVSVR